MASRLEALIVSRIKSVLRHLLLSDAFCRAQALQIRADLFDKTLVTSFC